MKKIGKHLKEIFEDYLLLCKSDLEDLPFYVNEVKTEMGKEWLQLRLNGEVLPYPDFLTLKDILEKKRQDKTIIYYNLEQSVMNPTVYTVTALTPSNLNIHLRIVAEIKNR